VPLRRGPAQLRALRARAATLTLPRPALRLELVPSLPSRRSLAGGLAILALGGLLYLAARSTSAFAVTHIEVRGVSPVLRAQVRRELAPLKGTSLLRLDGTEVVDRAEALPSIVSATYDRDFPHTLRVTVVAERAVAVLHRGGKETWLLSARGRILRQVPPFTHPRLPRIWVPRSTAVTTGLVLPADVGGVEARALAVVGRFPAHVDTAGLPHGELVLQLRSGIEVRLGEPTDVRLKLAIARRALPHLPGGTTYLDVSVPGRPVAGDASTAAPPPTTLTPAAAATAQKSQFSGTG
jgi:cell division protein FtsQ